MCLFWIEKDLKNGNSYCIIQKIALSLHRYYSKTVNVAQLVRASDCGSEGRGFEPHLAPGKGIFRDTFFCYTLVGGGDVPYPSYLLRRPW